MGRSALKWRGQIESWGVWFPPEARTAERLLALWEEGSRAFDVDGGWLLVFSSPKTLDADRTSLLPVVQVGEGWATFPSAQPQSDEFVLKWQGSLRKSRISTLNSVDLAKHWDSSSLRYLEGEPIGVIIVEKPEVLSFLTETNTSVREVLTTIPEAALEQREWLQRSKQQAVTRESSNPLLGLFDLLASFFDSKSNQRYLTKMMTLFEKEQWQEALRHAIPLGDNSSNEAIERFLGKLAPRKDLSFTPKQAGGSAIGTSLSGVELLCRTYHEASISLLRAGKIEEAAFIQAELLDDVHAAVRLLEEHGLYESAAKLATIKGLPAAQQVGLWFQAGQTERALQLARCHGVHAEALHILEHRDMVRALAFQTVWARDLADANNLSEAVEVGWKVRSDLPNYEAWLLKTLDGDDLGAARALALVLTDHELSRQLGLARRLQDWFVQDDPFTVRRQRHLLGQLVKKPMNHPDKEVRAWASEVARKVMRRSNSPWSLGDNKTLEALVKLSGDPWLEVDRPKIPKSKLQLNDWHQVVEQKGKLSVFDAASLGDGRFLVALGHIGLAVVSGKGAYSQRFDLPAHGLVPPLRGELFLTLSQGRLGCFRNNRARALRSVSIDGVANYHDGHVWFVWSDRELFGIDLAGLTSEEKSRWQALSRLSLDSAPRRVAVAKKAFGVLMEDSISYYDTGEMKLVTHKLLGSRRPALATPNPAYHSLPNSLRFAKERFFESGKFTSFEFHNDYCVAKSGNTEGLTLCIFQVTRPKHQFILELPGARFAQVRAQDREVVICDSTGRLLIADPLSQNWLGQFFL